MPPTHEYAVSFEDLDGGPDAALRERWAATTARRLRDLEDDEGYYPVAGTDLEILDDGEEGDEPSAVYLEVVSVDPDVTAPAPSREPVQVVVRVVFLSVSRPSG